MIDNKVIVWGVDDYNTLALIRQVGQGTKNIFFLLKGKPRYAAFSKYCSEYKAFPTDAAAFEFLKENFKNEKSKPIILTSSDGIVTFIDKHKKELEGRYIVPGTSEQGKLETYIDKYNMTKLAEKIGIAVPKSKSVMWDTDVSDVKFPCFVKPSHQKPGHYNEFKFRYCESLKDLKETLKFVRHDSVFIVQEYIKKENDLLVYGCRTPQGNTYVAGCLVTNRFAVGNGSSYGIVERDVHPAIDGEKVKVFLETIGYVGLFSFEYGLSEGKAYFFETNLRNDGTSHFFFQSGANIPLAYVMACAGLEVSPSLYTVSKPQYYMDEIFDISNVIIGNVSRKEWKRQRNSVTAFKFYDENDMTPYYKAKKHRYIRILRDIFIKKYRLYIMLVMDKIGLRK